MGNRLDPLVCQTVRDSTAEVWFTPTDAVNCREMLIDYQKLLDSDERRRYEAFHFPADRQLYLVAHALLRTSLSRYAAVSPQDWRFSGGSGGLVGLT